jgi:hemolysin activation/secretion protein
LILPVFGVPALAASVPPSVEPGVVDRPFQEKKRTPQSDVVIPAPDAVDAPANASEITLTLSSLTVEGSTVFTAKELAPLFRDKIGTKVTLVDLYAIAGAITGKYAERGYALCIAFLPAQRISNGAVRIQVVEGYIDAIELAEDSEPLPPAAHAYLENLKTSKPLTSRDLERALLLANDVPGLRIRGTFDKGKEGTGATKLIVSSRQDIVGAFLQASNRGSRAVGRYLAQAGVDFNSVFGLGEQLSFQGVQAFQWKELHYGRGALSFPIGEHGTRIAGSLSYSESDPGTPDLDLLNFISNGWTGGLEASHPIIRSRSTNLSVNAGFTGKVLDSDLLGTTNSSDRIYIASLGARYNWNDREIFVQLGAEVHQGFNIFNATTEGSPDRSRANGSGEFTAFVASADLERSLGTGISIRGSIEGQVASRGLLASEECGYGGEPYGRGFDSSEIAGDHCIKGMVELQVAPFAIADDPNALGDLSRTLTLHAFYDAGVAFQEGTIFPGEKRQASGHSIGAGFRLSPLPNVSASVEYAVPLTRDVTLDGDRDGRVFFSIQTRW